MPEGIAHFLTPQELHRFGRLVLQSRYVVEGNLAGRHRSPLKGASSEFAEHRAYIAGDDPRHIDWKVLGRTDRYYIRRYEDETNLRVYLVLDRSASMSYGSHGQSKYDYACRLAAALGYVVVKAKDSVGLYLYGETIDAMMAAKNSLAHLNNALKVLERHRPSEKTATAKTLHSIADAVRRRALIVLFSDLFDDTEEVVKALAHFRRQHHDVIVFHVLDPAELEFPFRKGTEFIDLETDEHLTTDPRVLAEDYRRVFTEFLDQNRRACSEQHIDYRLVNTNEPVEIFVRAYLEERRKYAR